MSEMVLEWLRDVQKMLKYRKYDVLGLCSTSSSAGNQVDGLPAVVVTRRARASALLEE